MTLYYMWSQLIMYQHVPCVPPGVLGHNIQQPEYDYMKVIDMYQLFKTIFHIASYGSAHNLWHCDRFYIFINNSLASFSVTLNNMIFLAEILGPPVQSRLCLWRSGEGLWRKNSSLLSAPKFHFSLIK